MPSFGTRIRNALRGAPGKSATEAYLDGATSIVDLEMREREISRSRGGRSSRPGYSTSF